MIDFVLFVLFAPFLLIGMILGALIDTLRRMFNLPLLFVGLWFEYLGAYFAWYSTLEPSSPFVSVVESLSQSHVFGVCTWLASLVAGFLLIVAAACVKRRTARGN